MPCTRRTEVPFDHLALDDEGLVNDRGAAAFLTVHLMTSVPRVARSSRHANTSPRCQGVASPAARGPHGSGLATDRWAVERGLSWMHQAGRRIGAIEIALAARLCRHLRELQHFCGEKQATPSREVCGICSPERGRRAIPILDRGVQSRGSRSAQAVIYSTAAGAKLSRWRSTMS